LPAQEYVFRAFQEPDGLKNLAVNALAMDHQGFLWVATENGLYRFQGADFKHYGLEQGLSELIIRDVVVDPSGILWAATSENLYRFCGDRFLPAGAEPIRIRGPWRIAAEDALHLLVVDGNLLYRLDHDAEGKMLSYLPVFPKQLVTSLPALSRINNVSVVTDGSGSSTVWAGCGMELCSFPADVAASRLAAVPGMVSAWGRSTGLPTDSWENVILDHSGTLWAAGLHHIVALPSESRRFIDRSIPDSNPESGYAHAPLLEDREGRILAPGDDGISRWDGTGWHGIGRANGLERASHITGMVFDATGELWLGGRGKGLFRWAGYAEWEGWTDAGGLRSPDVWSIVPYKANRVLVGTDDGPASVNPRTGEASALVRGRRWTYGSITSMGVLPDGAVFVATVAGKLLRLNPDTGQISEMARLSVYTISAFEDAAADLFLATESGIYISHPGAGAEPVLAANELLGRFTRVEAACQLSSGPVWFLSHNRLLRFDGHHWLLPAIDGLPSLDGSLLALSCASDGSVWLAGERAGVWRLTEEGNRLHATRLQLPEDLRSLACVAIFVDSRGWVWLGTDLGLIVWDGQRWRHLTQESGLVHNDVNQGSIQAASDGSLWIGTSGGVSHLLRPDRVFESLSIPVSITAIWRGDRIFPANQPLTLDWSEKSLRFDISSPAMRNRSELLFQYRVEELQQEWSEVHGGVAEVSNLPPGNYTFAARASNPGLGARSNTVKIKFSILPPWWRTWWFFALSCMALLAILLAIDRLRIRRLREKAYHLQLESLVSERTRELEESREQLRRQATHDSLTGMLNRRGILRSLEVEMERARRESFSIILVLADLDYFKCINDTWGHIAGDQALCWFANAVSSAIRSYDRAGRYGGEEFLIVLTEIPAYAAESRLTSLHNSISNLSVPIGQSVVPLTCSLGATVFDPGDDSANTDSLLAAADHALYSAKACGRNRFVFYSHEDLNAEVQVSTDH